MSRAPILAILAATLLLAGCTSRVQTLPPEITDGDTVSVGTVHVVLNVETDHPVTIRYSNGVTTQKREFDAQAAAGDTVNTTIEFDAPRPYVAVATMVSEFRGELSCTLVVDDVKFDSSAGSDGTFDICQTVETRTGPDEPVAGEHPLQLKSTSTSNGVVVWATDHRSSVDKVEGHNTIAASQKFGPIHMAVVSALDNDKSTCSILIDGDVQASGKTSSLGDIATCTAAIK